MYKAKLGYISDIVHEYYCRIFGYLYKHYTFKL